MAVRRSAVRRLARSPSCGQVTLAKGLLYAALAALLAGLPLPARSQAQSTSYAIPRQTVDGGGGRSASPSHVVEASIGQSDAGPPMSSATFTLRGGFQRPAPASAADTLFRDGFEPS